MKRKIEVFVTLFVIAVCMSLVFIYNCKDLSISFVLPNNQIDNLSNVFWGNQHFEYDKYIEELQDKLRLLGHILDDHNGDIFNKCRGILNKTELYKSGYRWTPNYGWSQARQDWIIYHTFFHGKTDGIYLDIGAHSPFYLSNTAFFDICLGWKGICVEPLQQKQKLFEKYRSCQLAQHCASADTKKLKMEFASFHAHDGDGSKIVQQDKTAVDSKQIFECDGISAQDLMNTYKPKNQMNETISIGFGINNTNHHANHLIDIDFISLDIEGAEANFLKCFPWLKYNVRVWAIETNKALEQDKIDRILYHYGYIKYKYLDLAPNINLDSIYIKDRYFDAFQTPYHQDKDLHKWENYQKCH